MAMQRWPRSSAGVVAVLVLVGACAGPVTDTPSPLAVGPSPTVGPTTTRTGEPSSRPTPTPAPTPTSEPTSVPAKGWVAAAPMLRSRTHPGVTVLGDGTVLAVGDEPCDISEPAGSETAERYDPRTDRWMPTTSLNKARRLFAIVTTPDGEALVIGGVNADVVGFSSTKYFDPARGAWRDGPLLDVARPNALAASMEDGSILVASTTEEEETWSTSTTEILARGAAAWTNGPSLDGVAVERLIPMADGQVLILGGAFEIFPLLFVNPSGIGGGWEPFPDPGFVSIDHLVALDDGGLLATGTVESEFGESPTGVPRRYDPDTGRWRDAAAMSMARREAQVLPLADGRIMFAGGWGGVGDMDFGLQATSEIYDPIEDQWSGGPPLLGPRFGGEAVLLDDDSVLILGGYADQLGDECTEPLTSVERWYP